MIKTEAKLIADQILLSVADTGIANKKADAYRLVKSVLKVVREHSVDAIWQYVINDLSERAEQQNNMRIKITQRERDAIVDLAKAYGKKHAGLEPKNNPGQLSAEWLDWAAENASAYEHFKTAYTSGYLAGHTSRDEETNSLKSQLRKKVDERAGIVPLGSQEELWRKVITATGLSNDPEFESHVQYLSQTFKISRI